MNRITLYLVFGFALAMSFAGRVQADAGNFGTTPECVSAINAIEQDLTENDVFDIQLVKTNDDFYEFVAFLFTDSWEQVYALEDQVLALNHSCSITEERSADSEYEYLAGIVVAPFAVDDPVYLPEDFNGDQALDSYIDNSALVDSDMAETH